MSVNRWRYPQETTWKDIQDRLAGRMNPENVVEERVRAILQDVADRGDEAVAEYTRRFDCESFETAMIRVPDEEVESALDNTDPRFIKDMEIVRESAERIRKFHEAQLERSWWTTSQDGTILGQIVSPVDRVGLYVPGGQGGETPLISSLLMNAVPAQVAGVERIAVASPPRKDGSLNPYILGAARILGVTEIYRMGSAWAAAAFAYGTNIIPAVDVIAGPGNIYLTTAKRLLIGHVGIDMIAGPSEISVVADGKAGKAAWVAADMLSQAEHDALASAICITWNEAFAEELAGELETQTEALPRSDIARQALEEWGAIVVTPDEVTALELVNRLAPEHLELMVEDPWSMLGRIRHAGAIFMGTHTPEPVGDYFAGPNHVLPTNGTARFSSALSVADFCKKSSVIAASPGYLDAHGEKVARFARLEGLEAHARSVESRFK
ncbi:histidinol dehydrogenase [Oceanidesulfovibrio indonesiensis]|uniref:Histidinol dehydrogenase n=1 Tax=Oceanidesulfovibrio indonesiensis TaxID=54767 RepID=A0A7M3MAJ0_9BACT|nr:histidinol dehydrogenase [Oceanidesulfovibrio indonesiensis]TVM14703.1 histidinol dehydrogenase [Oceanidesulfovibrio indonesiensis]